MDILFIRRSNLNFPSPRLRLSPNPGVRGVVAGKPNVRTVQPFTSVDLKQIPFPEILRNFQIMEAENAPVYPLQFLYPNTPKDQVFGKYYDEKYGGEQLRASLADEATSGPYGHDNALIILIHFL